MKVNEVTIIIHALTAPTRPLPWLQLREEITAKNQEMERESRRKVKLEKDLKSTLAELEARSSEVKGKQNQLMKADEEYARCEQQLRETRVGRHYLGLVA